MSLPPLPSEETEATRGEAAENPDRRTPKARKVYAFLWFFMMLCVIFAAIVLFVKA